jgi:transposase-like protein
MREARDIPTFDPLRYVWVPPVHCPACQSTNHVAQRSSRSEDGVKAQARKCRTCGHNFVALHEDPDS